MVVNRKIVIRYAVFFVMALLAREQLSAGGTKEGGSESAPSAPPAPRAMPANDNTKAGVVIERTDSSSDLNVKIYIDGNYVSEIAPGRLLGFELQNGHHTVYTSYVSGDLTINSEVRSVYVNNNRYLITVRVWPLIKEITIGYNSPMSVTAAPAPVKAAPPPVVVAPPPVTAAPPPVASVPAPVKAAPTPAPAPGVSGLSSGLLDFAVSSAFDTLSQYLPPNAQIAIVNIAAAAGSDQADADFIMEELTVLLVNSKKFTVVDRKTLDAIRQERSFQLSGEVDDDSVISIGKFLGASVVITGTISGAGGLRRLRLRALDVQTAQVVAMSSERI